MATDAPASPRIEIVHYGSSDGFTTTDNLLRIPLIVPWDHRNAWIDVLVRYEGFFNMIAFGCSNPSYCETITRLAKKAEPLTRERRKEATDALIETARNCKRYGDRNWHAEFRVMARDTSSRLEIHVARSTVE